MSKKTTTQKSEYRVFVPEAEYVRSFKDSGRQIPPFTALLPYEVRDGVPGYLFPCKADHPGAELAQL